jgi:hypothetical protein
MACVVQGVAAFRVTEALYIRTVQAIGSPRNSLFEYPHKLVGDRRNYIKNADTAMGR